MIDMMRDERVYTDRQREEGRLLIKEAGIELAIVALICVGGLSAVIYGLEGIVSVSLCVMAGGGLISLLCGIALASFKQHCRGIYTFSVFIGTLPFVGAVGYSLYNRTLPHLKYYIYGCQLGWLASFALTLITGFMVMHYLATVFLTYFKLFQSEDVDAYLGRNTSTGLL